LTLWHRSGNSILLSLHILVKSSRLTVLLGWHKTGLRITILRRCHIWVWIHSVWLSINWLGRHHSIWLSINWLGRHHSRLNINLRWRHHSRLNIKLRWRHIVWIHSRLSKILGLIHIRIILRLRGFIVMMLCYYFFFINISRLYGFTSITTNYATDDYRNAATKNYEEYANSTRTFISRGYITYRKVSHSFWDVTCRKDWISSLNVTNRAISSS